VPDKFKTIQEAVNKAKPGDTVFVKAGTYTEWVRLKKDIHLIGERTDGVIIQGDSLSNSVISIGNCQKTVISGITVKHIVTDDRPSRATGIFIENSSVEISDCRVVKAVGNGIGVCGNSSAIIKRSLIEKNGFCGIRVAGKNTSATIQDCNIINNANQGIFFREGATGFVEKSTVEQNKYDGIVIRDKCENVSLKNNSFRSNEGNGIRIFNAAQAEVESNICDENEKIGIAIIGTATKVTLKSNHCKTNQGHGICFAKGASG
jgi:parallel beta-helix repeat protein